jgi:L-aspartate oxidase
MNTDILVIGSGISGLSYALKVAQELPHLQICMVTKAQEDETNTKYAQGGLAVVLDSNKDNFEKHVQDTMLAGDGQNNEAVVRMVVSEGPKRFEEIVAWGVQFDQEQNGKFKLGREGGHTENRIVHHKDITGAEIERALLAKAKSMPNLSLLDYHYVIDLITEHHLGQYIDRKSNITCFGAYVLNKREHKIIKITSKITLMASGGVGHVYSNTTNPEIATGDGVALAYRAKAKVSNMQYIQFHPTALFSKRNGRLFLISEAVRGDGAKLRTKHGQPFMQKYDEREELASRDIVARAIDNEMKISGDDHVALQCSHMDPIKFKEHFPNIYQKCLEEGIDPLKNNIPVVPACHYLCGGIDVDTDGQTSIKNLFAVGECTNTGLHGANRLASNSLLEALVYGHNAAIKSVDLLKQNNFDQESMAKIPQWNAEGMKMMDELVIISYLRKDLQSMMSDLMSIVRSNARMAIAMQKYKDIQAAVDELYNYAIISPQFSELRNLASVAYLIIKQSMEMTQNKGAFYNKDFAS